MTQSESLDQSGRSTRSLTWRAKLVYGVIVTVGFFVLLECTLGLFGVQSTLVHRDPFVGFESSIPLFVPSEESSPTDPSNGKRNKLRYFNSQQFPREKAPDTVRVFCVGGSTTFGRPFDDRTSFAGWLRELLPLVDSDRRWEVINAGGVSYASYRVASVMDELASYSPDLFIVYTGHNEFLEERTYRDIREASPQARRWSAALLKSRTYSLALHLLGNAPSISDDDARFVLPGEVDTILDHTVGPASYHRDDQLRSDITKHFRFNLDRMIKTARSSGAAVILVKPASNQKDFSPFKSEFASDVSDQQREEWSKQFSSAQKMSSEGDFEPALATLNEIRTIDDSRADLHFHIGKTLFALGRRDEARQSFERAIDSDICPLRATSVIRQTVEQAAVDHRATLVDFESIITNACIETHGHGSPGAEYFLDHVHPSVESHRLLALAILQALSLQGITTSGSPGEEKIAEASRRIESRIDEELQARALTNLAQVLSWSGKRAEAGPLAIQAVRLRETANLEDDPECMLYAAIAYALEGEDSAATRLLERVVEIEPANKQARWRLAALLYDQQDFELALIHFREAVRLDPKDDYSRKMVKMIVAKLNAD